MQADAGLVKNVENAAQARADLRGQANALRFAAGKRGGGTLQAEIAETDGKEELDAFGNFFQRARGDFFLALCEVRKNFVHRGPRGGKRESSEISDGPACEFHCEGFGAETLAVARTAERGGHVLRHPLAVSVGAGLFEISFEKFQDSREAKTLIAFGLFFRGTFLAGRAAVRRRVAVQKHVLDVCGKFFEGRFEIEAVRVGAQLERALEDRGTGAWAEVAVKKRAAPIIDDPRRIEIVFRAEAVAGGACAVRRIETEGARFKLRNGNAAIGARELFRKSMFLAANDGDGDEPACQFERRGDRLLKARGNALLNQQAVHDNFDGVILAFVERRKIVKLVKLAIDADADVAILRKFFEFLAIRAFSSADDGREDHDAVVGLANLAVQNGLHDLLAGLARDRFAAIRAMRHADGRVDDAEIIVNLGDGADGGARRPRGGFLFDGDRRGKAFDDVDFRALHLVEELARVGGERFDVAALAFGIDSVEGERGFARAGKAGDDREAVPGDFDADIFEVVLARAPDYQFGQAHVTPIKRKYSLHRSLPAYGEPRR